MSSRLLNHGRSGQFLVALSPWLAAIACLIGIAAYLSVGGARTHWAAYSIIFEARQRRADEYGKDIRLHPADYSDVLRHDRQALPFLNECPIKWEVLDEQGGSSTVAFRSIPDESHWAVGELRDLYWRISNLPDGEGPNLIRLRLADDGLRFDSMERTEPPASEPDSGAAPQIPSNAFDAPPKSPKEGANAPTPDAREEATNAIAAQRRAATWDTLLHSKLGQVDGFASILLGSDMSERKWALHGVAPSPILLHAMPPVECWVPGELTMAYDAIQGYTGDVRVNARLEEGGYVFDSLEGGEKSDSTHLPMHPDNADRWRRERGMKSTQDEVDQAQVKLRTTAPVVSETATDAQLPPLESPATDMGNPLRTAFAALPFEVAWDSPSLDAKNLNPWDPYFVGKELPSATKLSDEELTEALTALKKLSPAPARAFIQFGDRFNQEYYFRHARTLYLKSAYEAALAQDAEYPAKLEELLLVPHWRCTYYFFDTGKEIPRWLGLPLVHPEELPSLVDRIKAQLRPKAAECYVGIEAIGDKWLYTVKHVGSHRRSAPSPFDEISVEGLPVVQPPLFDEQSLHSAINSFPGTKYWVLSPKDGGEPKYLGPSAPEAASFRVGALERILRTLRGRLVGSSEIRIRLADSSEPGWTLHPEYFAYSIETITEGAAWAESKRYSGHDYRTEMWNVLDAKWAQGAVTWFDVAEQRTIEPSGYRHVPMRCLLHPADVKDFVRRARRMEAAAITVRVSPEGLFYRFKGMEPTR